MISDLLSTRHMGTNPNVTTKVTSAVDQDKAESFTLLALPVEPSVESMSQERSLDQTTEHLHESSYNPFLNQYINDLSDPVPLTAEVPVAQEWAQAMLDTEDLTSTGLDAVTLAPLSSLTTPTVVAPLVPVTLPIEASKAESVGRTPASLVGLSLTSQRGTLFSSGMASSMALVGSAFQPASSMSAEIAPISSALAQDTMTTPFSDSSRFDHLKADTSMFQRVLAELRGHEAKDINAIGTQPIVSTQAASATQWGPVSLTPTALLAQQAQEILTPLREHLRFQVDQNIKKAELRLDPPELGKIDLNIRLEGDRLQVHMHAVNPAIRDALLNGLERLRMDLAMDHGGQIDVDVGQGGSQQHQQETALFASSIAPETAMENGADVMTREKSQLDLLA
ncbi:flagellar hook-length control protein FliK [Shewanella putrefaciens]|uniref:flagellar hook-length control protein FliK n=1 Tax=Shewanella putrefaciens TaxID=24 RepID=UPI00285E41FD|nr:flagellar hook-length control protein FliK [Shewanella putrefaciens]MDR6962158.1 flagellar hook-length control protein FliK [Shewanella putrefaciens]